MVDLRGGDSSYGEASDLKKLYMNREMLVAIATEAKETLEIRGEVGSFSVTKESLRGDFGVPNTPILGPTAGSVEAAKESKPRRRASKKPR